MLLSVYSNLREYWHISILRYFNPAGNHFSGKIGENPKNMPTNLFPLICKVASGEIKKVIVHGNNWDTFDGSGVRDYIHVMDLAEGHIKALNYSINKKKSFLVLNLGTGKGTSVFELINTFEKVNGIKVNYEIGSKRLEIVLKFMQIVKKLKIFLVGMLKDHWLIFVEMVGSGRIKIQMDIQAQCSYTVK